MILPYVCIGKIVLNVINLILLFINSYEFFIFLIIKLFMYIYYYFQSKIKVILNLYTNIKKVENNVMF